MDKQNSIPNSHFQTVLAYISIQWFTLNKPVAYPSNVTSNKLLTFLNVFYKLPYKSVCFPYKLDKHYILIFIF